MGLDGGPAKRILRAPGWLSQPGAALEDGLSEGHLHDKAGFDADAYSAALEDDGASQFPASVSLHPTWQSSEDEGQLALARAAGHEFRNIRHLQILAACPADSAAQSAVGSALRPPNPSLGILAIIAYELVPTSGSFKMALLAAGMTQQQQQ